MHHRRRQSLTWSVAILVALTSYPALAWSQSAAPSVVSSEQTGASPLKDLMVAAQGLRDATHELAGQQASPDRNQTIQKIDRTLAQLQSAMVSLPPEILRAEESATPSQKAAEDLARAADQLQEAAASLNKTGHSGGGEAGAEIRKALTSVQRERSNLESNQNGSSNQDQSPHGNISPSQAQTLPEQLKQKMQTAGYTNVEIVPGSYLVSAKSQDGKNVMMRIGPNSMTVLTEVASGSEQSATEGQGSSQPK